jgi:hypothetical protein
MVVNPKEESDVSYEAMERYEDFFEGQEPPEISEIETPSFDEAIVIGQLIDLSYLCYPKQARGTEKEGDTPFRHKFSKPYPMVLVHPNGRAVMIVGGKFKVTDWFRG